MELHLLAIRYARVHAPLIIFPEVERVNYYDYGTFEGEIHLNLGSQGRDSLTFTPLYGTSHFEMSTLLSCGPS